mgnify:CR=1 FL=1
MKLLGALFLLISFSTYANQALLEAVKNQNAEEVERILANQEEAKIDVNIQDEEGKTPLIHAAQLNNEAIVFQLISAGADANIKDSFGNSAYIYSYMNYSVRIYTYLQSMMNYKPFIDMVDFNKAVKACDQVAIDEIMNAAGVEIQSEYRDIDFSNGRLKSVLEVAVDYNCLHFIDVFVGDPNVFYNLTVENKQYVFDALIKAEAKLSLELYTSDIGVTVDENVMGYFVYLAHKHEYKDVKSELLKSLRKQKWSFFNKNFVAADRKQARKILREYRKYKRANK